MKNKTTLNPETLKNRVRINRENKDTESIGLFSKCWKMQKKMDFLTRESHRWGDELESCKVDLLLEYYRGGGGYSGIILNFTDVLCLQTLPDIGKLKFNLCILL